MSQYLLTVTITHIRGWVSLITGLEYGLEHWNELYPTKGMGLVSNSCVQQMAPFYSIFCPFKPQKDLL